MFLNIFILMFIIAIAYWQGLQGFFSAFLHLVLVIVAGTLAFAFWEPISMGMLAGMMPRFAWAIGLIMPFVFFLLILRVLMDKYVPANVDFSQLTNLVAGGVCGALAAAITAGVFVIAISYLPGAGDNFGYRPYTIDPASGRPVKSDGGLWIGVDSLAANLFTSLSNGSFAPANGKSLETEQPDLIRRAALLRSRPDANSSTVATPGSVKVLNQYSHPLPTAKLPAILLENLPTVPAKPGETDIAAMLKDEKNRLVAVETEWTNLNKNYDSDRLRIYPQQVQLVTSEKGSVRPIIHLPFAVSRQTNKSPDDRELAVVNRDDVMVGSSSTEDAVVTFLFVVPAGQGERYLLVRNLRLPLTATPADAEPPTADKTEKVVATIGTSLVKGGAADAVVDPTKTGIGETTGGKTGVRPEDVTVTADLPMMTSKNFVTQLDINNRNEIRSGTATATRPDGPISAANQVTKFQVPDDQAMVRVKMSRQAANSYLSHAQAAAGALNAMFITDNKGNEWFPVGYVWFQKGSSAMQIRFDTQQQIRAVTQFPIRQMGDTDELYAYFLVKRGIRLDKLKVGNIQSTELNQLQVP